MIFDDLNQVGRVEPSAESARKRRSHERNDNLVPLRRKRRRRINPSPERKTLSDKSARRHRDSGNVAWLWVLGLLIVATLGFSWYLHHKSSPPYQLLGDAPTTLLMPYIDPILAPLETGVAGYSAESLMELTNGFRSAREKINHEDQDIYTTAITVSEIMKEALEDRGRHIERLLRLGSAVEGATIAASEVRHDIIETERRHLELAIGISWQRNSITYRNRIEELWARLLRLEYGRFKS
jgi:hypothetical protein